jgi:predicted Zn-dependent peptidase
VIAGRSTACLILAATMASCCPAPLTAPVAAVPTPAPAVEPTPAPPVPPDAWTASGVDWSKPPAAGPEPTFTPPVPSLFEIGGTRVVLVENHRLPLVSVRVVFHRAGAREDGAKAGLAALTADLLVEGAGRLDALRLPEELERLGADIDVGLRTDAATVGLDTLRETLEPSLGLLADVIVRPTLSARDFERVRGDRLAALALRPDQPREVAAVAFERLVYGTHPYAAPGSGYASTVKALRLGDVKAFWDRRYRAADATILVVGDVDRATIEPMLTRAFARWRRGAPLPAASAPAVAATTPMLAVVDRPGAPQSVVMIGRLAGAAGDAITFPAAVANAATGGSFMSRLNGRLREELGYTYGIRSDFWRGRWAGTWAIATSFDTANTVAGIREALAIVEAVRTSELPAAELEKAIHMLTRSAPQEMETNEGIAAAFEGLIVDGRPLDWHQGWAAAIRAVTASALRAAVADAWSGLSIVVVGDRAKIDEGLRGLGLPTVRVDTDGKPLP